ncbi:16S rRNA (guanine(966)-N(2))-methyltransferase RsmD [Shimia sp.]|uniref:16S rRNA (guanine(966)-N(2))-methyltransferase RsmD n=1 Tax=Shimia sp. TaxID=1954381 RepID=UPI003B8D9944
MRIIGGKWRGTSLSSVGKGDAANHLRPTTDRVRESVFNVLQGGRFGDPVFNARVLDLFAGTGALGLEALSRGAAYAAFVDDGRIASRLLQDNFKKLGIVEQISQLQLDATRLRDNPETGFDLVFVDPPYGKNLGTPTLLNAAKRGWFAEAALIVWEESAPQVAPQGFEMLDMRRYGDTHISFLRQSRSKG